MLRAAVDDPQRRARYSAVYGIIGFVSVPITYFSTRWFQTIHPDLGQTPGFGLTASMRPPMFVAIIAFTLVYIKHDDHPHAGRGVPQTRWLNSNTTS
jgi:heme exporter protein C